MNTACPDALFVYSPDDERDAMLAAAGFETETDISTIVAAGYLHMLKWPKQETAAQRLMSRCTDGLLPIEITRTMPVMPLFGDRRRMQRVIDGEVPVNWIEAKRKLPTAPLFLVAIQDIGDSYHFIYTKQFTEIARSMGESLARGIHDAGPTRH